MALQVWLPLNGNLNNQGLTNVTVTNSGTTVDNNGKIGKCYSFNGSSSYVQGTPAVFDNNTDEFSVACWMNLASTSNLGCLFANRTAQNLYGITIFYYGGQFYFDDGDRWEFTPSVSLAANTWYHLVFTRKKGVGKKLYINGSLDMQTSSTGTLTQANSTSFAIGTNLTGGNYFYGKLNDFRIYDHALSPKEIEILSRGLVCHYPLCDSAVEATTNLVTSITAGGRTTVNGDTVTTTGEDKDTYFFLNTSEKIINGQTYTLSCDVSGIASGEHWRFSFYSDPAIDLYNGHNEITFTAKKDSSNTQLILDDTYRPIINNPTTFSHFQLEKKDHATLYAGLGGTRSGDTTVYDCSGFQNNGTVSGSLIVSSDTARYSVSTVFDGNSASIQIPNLYEMLGSNGSASYSISVWTYKSQIGTKSYQTILGGGSGFEIEARNAAGTDPEYVLWSWGKIAAPYEFNKWNHMVFTKQGSEVKLYVNGVLANQGTSSTGIVNSNYFIGAWNTATQQNYEGQMSDFRVYATALSAAQVADLYNTAVSVANNGTLMGYELVEV